MSVLVDYGDGEICAGKLSGVGCLREWSYTREIADMVIFGLRKKGVDAERIVKEDTDVPLSERCRRANDIYKETGKKAILVSIHCNAAGSGANWMNAKGWSVYVSNNASSNSKKMAECLGQVAECIPVPVRKPMPDQLYWQQNLAICRDTNCPAILSENFFQDNKEDVDYLLSREGKDAVARIHIEGIIKYLGL